MIVVQAGNQTEFLENPRVLYFHLNYKWVDDESTSQSNGRCFSKMNIQYDAKNIMAEREVLRKF